MRNLLSYKDIAKIFEEIELRLIASLKRNLLRHKAEEKKYGKNWSAWQAEKLRNIERFRRENLDIMNEYVDIIDDETRELMEEQFREGEEEVEQAVSEFFDEEITPIPTKHFFGVNNEKMQKLITDVTALEKTAETAVLRMTDDIYRQTVNRVQLAMAAGEMTLPVAIDMATKDFLNAGINCIVYKDGKRVNIADYVRMALQTCATRATLQGKVKRFAELGYDTVLVSAYGGCSETCEPYQGRVFIDDVFTVWSGERNGDMGKSIYCGKWFPLLSFAIRGGLFHPNCRHTLSQYIDGFTKIPEPIPADRIKQQRELEQKQRMLERKIRKLKRFAEGTQNPEIAKAYRKKLRETQHELKAFVDEHKDLLRRDSNREKYYGEEKYAANAAVRNTGARPIYNPKASFKVKFEDYPDKTNESISKACKQVAYMGAQDHKEHMYLVDINNNEICYFEDGDESGVGGADFWKFISENKSRNLSFIHNHISDGYFSESDMRTLLSTENIKSFIAVRLDGIIYGTQKKENVKLDNFYFDNLYPKEMKVLTEQVRSGKISVGERVKKRETIIVDNLLKDYTKGLIEFDTR